MDEEDLAQLMIIKNYKECFLYELLVITKDNQFILQICKSYFFHL